jgi:hypothetical protein
LEKGVLLAGPASVTANASTLPAATDFEIFAKIDDMERSLNCARTNAYNFVGIWKFRENKTDATRRSSSAVAASVPLCAIAGMATAEAAIGEGPVVALVWSARRN